MSRRTSLRRLLCALPFVVLATAPLPAAAQGEAAAWPSRPIRYIVPFPPGGPTDVISRQIAEAMREDLGQPVVIENVGGANGSLGEGRITRAAPDGYTIGLGNTGTHTINPSLYPDLPYDAVAGFTPISLITEYANILLVNADLPVRDLKELLALSRARPLNYASAGIGSSNHLSTELLRSRTGLAAEHIPYKGSAAALLDLTSGRVAMMFDVLSTALPAIDGKKARAIATSGAQRHPLLPDVPAIGETVPGFEFKGWMAVFGPAGLPQPIRDRLNQSIARALKLPAVAARLTQQGYEPRSSTPAELAQRIEADGRLWGDVIRNAGIRPE